MLQPRFNSILGLLCLISTGIQLSIADFPYNEETALKFLYLAKAAYADSPAPYLDVILPQYEVLEMVKMECEYDSKCAGYLAKSKSNDTIVVGFRGTHNPMQLLEEGANVLRPRKDFTGGYVHPYFYVGHELLWERLVKAVLEQKDIMGDPNLYVTGHSLGGALASLFAAAVAEKGYFSREKIFVITFGEPRVGNKNFSKNYDRLVPQTWRVVHHRDIVPHVPPCQFLPWRHSCADGTPYYYHHGTEVFYPEEKMIPGEANYTICYGMPQNEDKNCSNALILDQVCYNPYPCIEDHLYYFDTHVSFKNHTFINRYIAPYLGK